MFSSDATWPLGVEWLHDVREQNIKSEMKSFKSNENIHKKEGGSYYVVSANKASSVSDPVITGQRKPEETYCNFASFK